MDIQDMAASFVGTDSVLQATRVAMAPIRTAEIIAASFVSTDSVLQATRVAMALAASIHTSSLMGSEIPVVLPLETLGSLAWTETEDLSVLSEEDIKPWGGENRLSGKKFHNYSMVEAFDLLAEFEKNLRRFIDQKMSAAYGPDWVKQKVHGDIWRVWQEKRAKAVMAGENQGRLIDYADFGDYAAIITRRDNWEQVFKRYFGRPEFVQESFCRLHPVRVCTMHARVLPSDLRLVLKAEVLQLSKRIWHN